MKKLIAPALVALSLTAPAHAMDLTELTDAERAQFRAEVRAFLDAELTDEMIALACGWFDEAEHA